MAAPALVDNNRFRILFICFNFVLWTSGLILLWIGIWLECEMTRYIRLDTKAISLFLLAVGSFAVLFNSIACFCVLKNVSPSVLSAYGLVLGVQFIVQIFLSVAMVYLKQELQVKFNAHQLLSGVGVDMNLIQTNLRCCGVHGVEDWRRLNMSVPMSCCWTGAQCDTARAENLWTQGCYTQMTTFIDSNIGTFALLVLSIAIVSLVGAFGAFATVKKYKREYEAIE